VRSETVGSEDTWDLGATVCPEESLKRLTRIGFEEVSALPDLTYPSGDRYWVIGRKPVPNKG
jgi:hypothetical protein